MHRYRPLPLEVLLLFHMKEVTAVVDEDAGLCSSMYSFRLKRLARSFIFSLLNTCAPLSPPFATAFVSYIRVERRR